MKFEIVVHLNHNRCNEELAKVSILVDKRILIKYANICLDINGNVRFSLPKTSVHGTRDYVVELLSDEDLKELSNAVIKEFNRVAESTGYKY